MGFGPQPAAGKPRHRQRGSPHRGRGPRRLHHSQPARRRPLLRRRPYQPGTVRGTPPGGRRGDRPHRQPDHRRTGILRTGEHVRYGTALRHRADARAGLLMIYPISRRSRAERDGRHDLFEDPERGVTVVGVAIAFRRRTAPRPAPTSPPATCTAMSDLEDTWSRIARPAPGNLNARRHPGSNRVWCAVDDSGRRHLLVETNDDRRPGTCCRCGASPRRSTGSPSETSPTARGLTSSAWRTPSTRCSSASPGPRPPRRPPS